tara:strand:+ start:1841 stop:2614 length:774 start_codon:yes stop_codon:yes gene_type:complete
MTIDEIYRLVQTFANKEQRGFITPSDFNLLAKQAELELINKRIEILQEKSQAKKMSGIMEESLTPEIAEQDLAPFLVSTPYKAKLVSVVSGYSEAEVSIDNNTLLIKEIFILPDENLGINSHIPLEIVSSENINKILRSSLAKPSIDFPIGLMSGSLNGQGLKIKIFPDNIESVIVYGYMHPRISPNWSYVTVAGKPVHDPSTSNQFNLPSRTHGEIVIKILEYLGVNLREVSLINYASTKEMLQNVGVPAKSKSKK